MARPMFQAGKLTRPDPVKMKAIRPTGLVVWREEYGNSIQSSDLVLC